MVRRAPEAEDAGDKQLSQPVRSGKVDSDRVSTVKRRVRFSGAALSFIAVLALAACARSAAINEDASYTIEITNPLPHAMNVAVNTGGGLDVLGLIDAGQTRQFQIRNPLSNDVTIIATGGPEPTEIRKNVELRRAQTVQITLSN
jgi:hypothetical protein